MGEKEEILDKIKRNQYKKEEDGQPAVAEQIISATISDTSPLIG